MKIRIVDLLKSDIYGIDVYVRGWVRTHRQSKNISFIALNDGSTVHNLQIVIEHVKFEKKMLKTITTGSSIGIKGKQARPLIVPKLLNWLGNRKNHLLIPF